MLTDVKITATTAAPSSDIPASRGETVFAVVQTGAPVVMAALSTASPRPVKGLIVEVFDLPQVVHLLLASNN